MTKRRVYDVKLALINDIFIEGELDVVQEVRKRLLTRRVDLIPAHQPPSTNGFVILSCSQDEINDVYTKAQSSRDLFCTIGSDVTINGTVIEVPTLGVKCIVGVHQ